MLVIKSISKKLRNSLTLLHSHSITYQEYLQGYSQTEFFENFEKISKIKDLQEKQIDSRITLYGIPFLQQDQTNDDLSAQITNLLSKYNDETKNSHCFVDLDPSLHLFKKRRFYSFLNEKFVYKGVFDTQDGLLKENPCKLNHPYETLLEPSIIDYETQLKYLKSKGQGAQFEKNMEEPLDIVTEEEREQFIKSLTEVLKESYEINDNQTNYEAMTQILLHHHVKEMNVFLCEIPAIYHRIILARALSLETLLLCFKDALSLMKRNPGEVTLKAISILLMGPYFESTRFFYLRSLLQEVEKMDEKQAKFSVFLRMDHFHKFQKYYDVENLDFSFEKAFNVPIRSNETDERLIEKHALLDFLLESNLWGRSYVMNPFPYISENYHNLTEEDTKELKKKFYVFYKKFERIKTEFLK